MKENNQTLETLAGVFFVFAWINLLATGIAIISLLAKATDGLGHWPVLTILALLAGGAMSAVICFAAAAVLRWLVEVDRLLEVAAGDLAICSGRRTAT